MNPNAEMYGLIKINDQEASLGNGKPSELMRRAAQTMGVHKGEANRIWICLSKAVISSFAYDPELAAREEFESMQANATIAAEEEYVPGLTIEEMMAAVETPEGKAYQQICNPVKRLGLTQIAIEQIKQQYFDRFPHIAPHFPIWQD